MINQLANKWKIQNPDEIIFLENEQTNLNQNVKYEFYKKQIQDQNKRFHLRFQSIYKSSINQNAITQLRLASQFQFKKFFIRKGKNVLQTEKKKNFISQRDSIKMTWMGHASVLLSINSNTHILIDPMFEDRIISSWFGQKRHIPPPCNVHELPKIDFVLISHDHYDHCNSKSLDDLYNKDPKHTVFIAGTNSDDILPKNSPQKCRIKMSWTQSRSFKKGETEVKITFVPACHWSKRGLNDQNKRLWGGFVIQTLGKKIYFAGDTGYCGLFKEIYQVFQGFDLSLLPIGAYEPNELLKAQHINPREAVEIHNQIKSKKSVGIHWGTFPMSHETPEQVLNDLNQAQKYIQKGEFITVKIGGSISID